MEKERGRLQEKVRQYERTVDDREVELEERQRETEKSLAELDHQRIVVGDEIVRKQHPTAFANSAKPYDTGL